jgi:hypothetical protein
VENTVTWPGPVNIEKIRAWCAQEQESVAPVDYEFYEPEGQRASSVRWLQRLEIDEHVEWNDESGTAEMILPDGAERYSTVQSRLIGDAEATDFRFVEEPRKRGEASPLIDEFRTALLSNGRAIRVLGPGGRVTAFRDRDRTFVDVTIRRRKEQPIFSGWRSPDTLLFNREMVVAPEISVKGSFGYLEASKYDRQDLLRLVYMFIVEKEPGETEGVGWRTVIVEPATIPHGLPPWAGLESWSSGF